ncbi:NmrA family NAD(P)-binding protein [Lipomyces tetrasporus]
MSTSSAFTIFVIGGTGAQGLPIVERRVKDKKYFCRILTRDVNSPCALKLEALGNAELVSGTFASEKISSGEKTEMYWAIRAHELAIEGRLNLYVYGNLDFVYKKSGYDRKFRTGHYDGKGRIGD